MNNLLEAEDLQRECMTMSTVKLTSHLVGKEVPGRNFVPDDEQDESDGK
jgi:hypothetical protein